MNSSKVGSIIIISALLLSTGLVVTGCREKPKNTWVNTNSMPGQTFKDDSNDIKPKSTFVYLGADKDEPNVNFGPKDVSFDFRDLH